MSRTGAYFKRACAYARVLRASGFAYDRLQQAASYCIHTPARPYPFCLPKTTRTHVHAHTRTPFPSRLLQAQSSLPSVATGTLADLKKAITARTQYSNALLDFYAKTDFLKSKWRVHINQMRALDWMTDKLVTRPDTKQRLPPSKVRHALACRPRGLIFAPHVY